MIRLDVNHRQYDIDVDNATPLLWVLREQLGLTGAKYGCGIGMCGNCTVLVDGRAVLSCNAPVAGFSGKKIITIEGIGEPDALHPVQQAWLDENVPECGYCQPGQILTAIALLHQQPDPDDRAIDEAMSRVLCRCGTYLRIRKAIKRAVTGKAAGQP
ncbi:MAG: isoquinoline 1-oxidoreductase subunit alpha [Pseudomonadota bacterium]|nr:isoquinoline 1-oxidoreductase subunit alpha [Pseudomonadota bacterium]